MDGNHLRVEFADGALSQEEEEAITALLNEHNLSQGFEYRPQALKVLLKDRAGKVVGGLSGTTNWGWLYIKIFAVAPDARGSGLGRKLIETAEKIALARGCKYAFLDTFSFQARPFYEKNGYEVFGTLDNYPENCKRFFMRKSLL